MSETREEVLVTREGTSVSVRPGAASRSSGIATTIDSLLVLAALLAFAFGWTPVTGPPEQGVAVVVGVALLWLLLEWRFPLPGFWGASAGWLPALTKTDVLVLLFALWSSLLLFLPLLVAVVAWVLVGWVARRGRRVVADAWFHRSALLTSFAAFTIAAQAAKVWLYSGPGGDGPPSPLDHAGFHQLLNGAIGVSCALLFLVLAWTALREGQRGSVAALLVSGLPVAVLDGSAAAIALINQRDYGYMHPYAWLLSVFWVLAAFSALRGLALQSRASVAMEG
jgi:hypothetical protein